MIKTCVESQIKRLPPEKALRITSKIVSSLEASSNRNTQKSFPKAKRKKQKKRQSNVMEVWSNMLHKVVYIFGKVDFFVSKKKSNKVGEMKYSP